MKIVSTRIHRKKELKTDMFAVLSIMQFVIMALIVLILFAFTKVNAGALDSIRQDLLVIFGEDMDIGGYFTPSEENTKKDMVEPAVYVSYEDKLPADSISFDDAQSVLQEEEEKTAEAAVPVFGTVTSYYGMREHPVYSGENFHGGLDIAADEGSDIMAVLDGVVTDAGKADMAGNYIKITHADGMETLYCHCSAVYLSEGDEVSQGDVIAAVGQTGLATGPHLHLEVHKNGENVDPMEYLEGLADVY